MTDYTKLEELYREWNAKINVISRKDIDNIREHHVMHSLAIAEYLRRFYGEDGWKAGESVLDVGTGGGFPGIPLAMEFPELKFTLCDSIGKKILVARSVAEALGASERRVRERAGRGRAGRIRLGGLARGDLAGEFLPLGEGAFPPEHNLPERRRRGCGNRRVLHQMSRGDGLREEVEHIRMA